LGFELVDLATSEFEFPELCHHFTFSEKSTQKKASCCTLSVASSSPWDQDIVSGSIGLHTQHLGITPQQGPQAPSTHQHRDVEPKSKQCWLDVRQLQETQGQERMVLRPLWFSLGGLHHLPEAESIAVEIVLKEVILDRPRSPTLGRPTWRRNPEAAAQENQRQRQRQGQGTQCSPADTTCTTSSTGAFWPGRATAAAMDEHASPSWSIDILNDHIVASRAEIEGSFQSTQKGESRNAHTGAAAVYARGNQSCQQEGCQDPLLGCGRLDKGKRGARHGDPGQEQPDGAMESLSHHVPGTVSSIYRPLPEPGAGASVKLAKERLHKAKEDFSSKEEAATVISDEEEESKATTTKESAAQILKGLSHMTESLQKLSDQAAEEQAEEERKAKRPRQKEGDLPDVAMPAESLPSMQPFGVPGH